MPAEHRIDTTNKIITTIWSGEATDSALLDALSTYQQDIIRQFDHYSYDEIVDFSEASSFELTTAGIVNIVRLAVNTDVQEVKTKMAIIVSKPLAYGLGRMYAIYRSLVPRGSKEVRVYNNHRDALEWIKNNAEC